MNNKTKKWLIAGAILILAFIIWTVLIVCVDVKPVGQNGTNIGFSTVNTAFHKLTGENMTLYTITDWLGLVPIVVCLVFAVIGLIQLIKRKSLKKVDFDIILLGIYYIIVIAEYLLFEMIPINYRPVLIEGVLEASYPSSTTLLVLSVMPTLIFQAYRRMSNNTVRNIVTVCSVLFSVFMVAGRLISGVHWLTDIIGALILSAGSFMLYCAAVFFTDSKKKKE